MKFQIDVKYLTDSLERIMNVPSPVGYYRELKPVLEEMAGELGCGVTYDKKSTAYITLDGEDNSKTVMVSAHADTLGFVVRCIEGNGMLMVRKLGGINFSSAEGETVTVHTRDGRKYSGLLICKSHSTHAFNDATTLERNEDTVRVLLDEDVKNKDDVRALGIQNGDYISIEPRFRLTEKGYVKSRFIDDKGGVAACFAALKYIKENGAKPKYRTIIAIPFYEEIGFGGSFVPEEVSEYVAVDIGLIGPELDGDERKVSICTKDVVSVYDYELTNKLIEKAKKADCPYATDVFMRYSTDAMAAWRGGNDLSVGAFGMAVYCSHGMERTHVEGLAATVNLILAYLLDI